MDINMETKEGRGRMRIEGEMTIYNASVLKKGLIDALHGSSALEVDLSQVNEMDTSGFQLLLLARREACIHGKSFSITSHSQATRGVLELYNMKDYFNGTDPVKSVSKDLTA